MNHVVPHDELLPFARALAADIVSNDQVGVRQMLAALPRLRQRGDARRGALLEGYMAETWAPGVSFVAERRADVAARGRAQTS